MITEHLRDGNMKAYKDNSGQNIVYKKHSTSAIGTLMRQGSADPTNLAYAMIKKNVVLRDG
jgi:hypothetical protein